MAGDAQTSQGIAVTGEGRVMVRPDIALISLGVETTAPTVAEARDAAATAMQAVQDAVTAQSVEDRDIQTRAFNIYPQYVYAEGQEPRITGFTVSNLVELRVRDVDAASGVLDAAVAAGGDATRVNGITFTVDQPDQHRADARRAAVEQAREHAQVLADAAGVELGAPISINEQAQTQPFPPPFAERSAQDAGGATPINPGEQELTVVVTVVFAIAS